MTATICLACGKETKNPKFCDRSCAAKFNNRKSPKRKPEGKCRVCGQQIQTSKSVCATCAKSEQAHARRKAQHIREWTRVSNERAERIIAPAHFSAKMVFDYSFGFGQDQLESTDRIDLLLDRLTAVCFSRPQYLRQCHAARHIVLLNEFRECQYESFRGTRARSGDVRIDELGPALYGWMSRVLREHSHPLMPSYVLDTITFIKEHVEETYRYRDWKIVPLVKRGRQNERIRFFDDSSFKRDFTQEIGTIFLLCKVPEGGRVVHSGKTVLEAGDRFLSTASRCHLSSGFYDHAAYKCEEGGCPGYDLHHDFEFYGSLFARRISDDIESDGVEAFDPDVLLGSPKNKEVREAIAEVFSHFGFYPSGFSTPAHWIEATIDLPPNFRWSMEAQINITPVPHWRVEFE